ncbi:MAG: hypothetical protein ACC662_03575, partial [Planctomycetota bacterium]
MPARRLVAAFLALLAVLGGSGIEGRAAEVRSSDVYLRRKASIPQTVRWLFREAARLGVGQVLLAFDAATFAPPPGLTEFSGEYLYADDLGAWIDAVAAEAATAGCPIRATSSLNPRSVRVGDPGWRENLRRLVERRWWNDPAIQEMEPAARWIRRLLLRTVDGIAKVTGESRRMLVLVTGEVTPERWSFIGNRPAWESSWRPKLLPIGRYWDAEKIAAQLVADGCRLYVVAPEARFGDFRPFVELPQAPWAARPRFPALRRRGFDFGSGSPFRMSETDEAALRRQLDAELKPFVPDPEERKRLIEAMLAGRRAEGGTPGPLSPRPWRPRPRVTTPGEGNVPLPSEPPPPESSGMRLNSITHTHGFSSHSYPRLALISSHRSANTRGCPCLDKAGSSELR